MIGLWQGVSNKLPSTPKNQLQTATGHSTISVQSKHNLLRLVVAVICLSCKIGMIFLAIQR